MKTSRKFATSPDILVAKGKHSVANATVLVAISSPDSLLMISHPRMLPVDEQNHLALDSKIC